MPTELAADLVQLALWDVVLYVDGVCRSRVNSSLSEIDISMDLLIIDFARSFSYRLRFHGFRGEWRAYR